MIKVNIKTAIYDFEWVIRITNSAETKTQIDVAYKCFNLWELKHVTNNVTEKELNIINRLRSKFWAILKNKTSQVVRTDFI
jgi:ABC-type histidine transport system ATPase subunit